MYILNIGVFADLAKEKETEKWLLDNPPAPGARLLQVVRVLGSDEPQEAASFSYQIPFPTEGELSAWAEANLPSWAQKAPTELVFSTVLREVISEK